MKPNIDKYRYCNYCKHFKIDKDRASRATHGSCTIKSTNTSYHYEFFDSPACDDCFEMTIHNWCGIEYPEYIREYDYAINVSNRMWWKIMSLKHQMP